jgi:hypothetical protein
MIRAAAAETKGEQDAAAAAGIPVYLTKHLVVDRNVYTSS